MTTHFCYDIFLLVALSFFRDNKESCCNISAFPDLAIFASFLVGFASFFIKTLQNINLGEDSIIMH